VLRSMKFNKSENAFAWNTLPRCGVLGLATVLTIASCGAPVQRAADPPAIRPSQVADFAVLFAQNCAACHGPDGQHGATIPIGDPVYLAIADDATIRRTASEGRPGTSMTAFAQAFGGPLTSAQIDVIVSGIRARWGKPGILRNAKPPAYAAQAPGDVKQGQTVFAVSCAPCHGVNGRGGLAGSLVDSSYLTLVSDQYLRTTVIAGRPALGMPDWRGHVPKSLSDDEVTNVVAWLAAQRPAAGSDVDRSR
jgi:cytochrome c oxidase cbb3-type subunit 3